ncbi:MAG: hypothetical protein ACLPKB_09605 [Xanthobacteraceae bacterium]
MTRPNRFNDYDIAVFINCPFDRAYKPLFDCLVFATICCGFRARCALEIDDGSQVRIDKIFAAIEECRFGIHDLSRTELDRATRLPRFNMPLELGMFLGAKRFGDRLQKRKQCLVLDRDSFRYQKYISDIAGQDIRAHGSSEKKAVSITTDWLRNCSGKATPGGSEVYRQYVRFNSRLPALCRELRLRPVEVTFNDYTNIATEWLKLQRTKR